MFENNVLIFLICVKVGKKVCLDTVTVLGKLFKNKNTDGNTSERYNVDTEIVVFFRR